MTLQEQYIELARLNREANAALKAAHQFAQAYGLIYDNTDLQAADVADTQEAGYESSWESSDC